MYRFTLSLTSALDAGGWSTPLPGRFAPGKDPVPIVRLAWWSPGPVCTGTENLAPTWTRSPDRPSSRKSLYRLSYPGPWLRKGFTVTHVNCEQRNVLSDQ